VSAMRQFTFQIETPSRNIAPSSSEDSQTNGKLSPIVWILFLLAVAACAVSILLYPPFQALMHQIWMQVRAIILA